MRWFHKHKYTNWSEVGIKTEHLITLTILERTCKKCGKKEIYEGLVNVCVITGEKTPYIYTD
jgi:hypothetical protein